VVEDRFVVVLAGDDDDLVPGTRVDDTFVVDLGSKVFGVDGWKGVTDSIHASPAVAAADDCDEFARLLVVISCDELDQWLLGGSRTWRRQR
jgi:hypothetical protein